MEKAYAFAEMLSSKFVLPADLHPEVISPRATSPQMCGFILIRERWVRCELKTLRVDQAPGPDEIPARLLIECAPVLCKPLCRILRDMMARRVLQQLWWFHRIAPLYKKRRGAHCFKL